MGIAMTEGTRIKRVNVIQSMLFLLQRSKTNEMASAELPDTMANLFSKRVFKLRTFVAPYGISFAKAGN